MFRSNSKNLGKKKKGCSGKDLQKRKVLSLEWKSGWRSKSSMHLSFHLAASDNTCRLDVDEEVHLPSTSFLKAILERVDGWRINIFLGQTIPSVYNALEKKCRRASHRQFFFACFQIWPLVQQSSALRKKRDQEMADNPFTIWGTRCIYCILVIFCFCFRYAPTCSSELFCVMP